MITWVTILGIYCVTIVYTIFLHRYIMASVSGIRIKGIFFDVAYTKDRYAITAIYLSGCGTNIYAVLSDSTKLKIFDTIFDGK